MYEKNKTVNCVGADLAGQQAAMLKLPVLSLAENGTKRKKRKKERKKERKDETKGGVCRVFKCKIQVVSPDSFPDCLSSALSSALLQFRVAPRAFLGRPACYGSSSNPHRHSYHAFLPLNVLSCLFITILEIKLGWLATVWGN